MSVPQQSTLISAIPPPQPQQHDPLMLMGHAPFYGGMMHPFFSAAQSQLYHAWSCGMLEAFTQFLKQQFPHPSLAPALPQQAVQQPQQPQQQQQVQHQQQQVQHQPQPTTTSVPATTPSIPTPPPAAVALPQFPYFPIVATAVAPTLDAKRNATDDELGAPAPKKPRTTRTRKDGSGEARKPVSRGRKRIPIATATDASISVEPTTSPLPPILATPTTAHHPSPSRVRYYSEKQLPIPFKEGGWVPKSPEVEQHVRERLCALWGEKGRDFFAWCPLPNPVNLTEATLKEKVCVEDYLVTRKTDGVRYSLVMTRYGGDMYSRGDMHSFVIDRAGNRFVLSIRGKLGMFNGSVFDGELCPHPTKPDCYEYWVFDCIAAGGDSMRKEPTEKRIERYYRHFYDPAVEPPSAYYTAKTRSPDFLECVSPGITIRCKAVVPASRIQRLPEHHASDGYVFSPAKMPLPLGTFWEQYKWKPEHTLDFELFADLDAAEDGPKVHGWKVGLYYVTSDAMAMMTDTANGSGAISYMCDACEAGVALPPTSTVCRAVLKENERLVRFLDSARAEGHASIRSVIECVCQISGDGETFDCVMVGERPDKRDGNNRLTLQGTLTEQKRDKITVASLFHALDPNRDGVQDAITATTSIVEETSKNSNDGGAPITAPTTPPVRVPEPVLLSAPVSIPVKKPSPLDVIQAITAENSAAVAASSSTITSAVAKKRTASSIFAAKSPVA